MADPPASDQTLAMITFVIALGLSLAVLVVTAAAVVTIINMRKQLTEYISHLTPLVDIIAEAQTGHSMLQKLGEKINVTPTVMLTEREEFLAKYKNPDSDGPTNVIVAPDMYATAKENDPTYKTIREDAVEVFQPKASESSKPSNTSNEAVKGDNSKPSSAQPAT